MGMIGGSIALGLNGYDVVGFDTDAKTCEYARSHGVCRIVPIAEMSDRDIVFVCVPLGVMRKTLEEACETLPDVIVTDVASVKAPFAGVGGRYVGGHPMAGRELGGIEQARAHLFQNAYYCITDRGEDAQTVTATVKALGALPIFMTPEEHDRAVSAFSHVPHAVAYSLVTSALAGGQPIAGSGFMDTTRIAQSDEAFWSEVFGMNADNVSSGIKSVIAELSRLDGMIERRDADGLREYLAAARKKRIALNRVDLGGEVLYVDLVDRIGEFERVTGAIAGAGINVTNIALVPARTGSGGALRLEFATAEDRNKAAAVLGCRAQA